MFTEGYSDLYEGDDNWRSMELPEGDTFEWQAASTHVRKPAFFEGMTREPEARQDIEGARALAKLGDSVTTDHISPAGPVAPASPPGPSLPAQAASTRD